MADPYGIGCVGINTQMPSIRPQFELTHAVDVNKNRKAMYGKATADLPIGPCDIDVATGDISAGGGWNLHFAVKTGEHIFVVSDAPDIA